MASPAPPSGDSGSPGRLGAAIANEIGKLVAEFAGRGATKSRAFVHDDVVVCLLEDGATKAEVHLVAAGRDELVRMNRDALQRVMEDGSWPRSSGSPSARSSSS